MVVAALAYTVQCLRPLEFCLQVAFITCHIFDVDGTERSED
jgi:hypothetical protein